MEIFIISMWLPCLLKEEIETLLFFYAFGSTKSLV